MSAINEWFGYNNAIYLYIREHYGQQVLEEYFDYLAKNAYSDVTPRYREGGLEAIRERYVKNFIKDGDENSVEAAIEDGVLTMAVRCPAFTHGVPTRCEKRQVGPFFCQCCETLNRKILAEAGYDLELTGALCGSCTWKIRPSDK